MVAFSGGSSGGGGAAIPTDSISYPVISCGTAPVALSGTASISCFAATIKSAFANTSVIYFGDNTITASGGGNVATQLLPSQGVSFDISDLDGLYVCSPGTAQKVFLGTVQ